MADDGLEIEFTPMEEFEFWLDELEDKANEIMKRPTSKEEATKNLELTKKLKQEVDTRSIPKELLDPDDPDDPKIDDMIDRYGNLRTALCENLLRTEELCDTWNKLSANIADLTKSLISSKGKDKLTMEKLESSIAEIKEMFAAKVKLSENFN